MGSSKIGVIDIGSNSFHMLVGGYINEMYYHITDDVKAQAHQKWLTWFGPKESD